MLPLSHLALGAYTLLSTAFSVLAVEGNSLWMLYTFPRPLHSLLLQKTLLWTGFALLYTGSAMAFCMVAGSGSALEAAPHAVLALIGVVIYSFIASGIGVLATDPLEVEVRRRFRPDMVYLYMLLASLFGYALYSDSIWTKVVQVVLSSLLAYALWQKVRDRTPYMLDPQVEPPPGISLADGLMAVLAFFILQGLCAGLLARFELPLSASIVLAFICAGAATALFSLYVFWRQKVPHLFAVVGFKSEAGSIPQALLTGAGAGLAAAAIGVWYMLALERFEPLRETVREALKTPRLFSELSRWWLAGLAVVAAPLFEEYIFRGLIFRGLRRSVSPGMAVFASAAIFAIVHPPISALPVFCLGIGAALSFEKCGLLLAPITAHMVYNAVILAFNWNR